MGISNRNHHQTGYAKELQLHRRPRHVCHFQNTALELLEHYHQQYGLKTFAFRFPTVYSYSTNHYIYPNGVKTLRPLYKLIFHAMESKPLEIWGDPNYAKDMLHVYDMAQMFCKAIEVQNLTKGFYNCGTGIPVTLRQQMEAIIEVFCPPGKPSEIICLTDKIAGRRYINGCSKCQR